MTPPTNLRGGDRSRRVFRPKVRFAARVPSRGEGLAAADSGVGMAVFGRTFLFHRRDAGLVLALVGLTLAVYGQVFRFEFVDIDDPAYVISNPHVLRGLNFDGVRWAFGAVHDSNWIPLTWLSLMLDATFFGSWPGGYHLTNAFLHLVNVLLLFAIFSRATGRQLQSALVAALFAVHPLHAESVAWIAERKDVLSMFFGLLSLWAYVCYAQMNRVTWLRAFAIALAVVSFVCSLMAKPTFVTLPFLLLFLDYWPLGRFSLEPGGIAGNESRAHASRTLLVFEKLPFFAISAAFCAIALWAQASGGAMRSLVRFPLLTRCQNAAVAYALYAWRAACPVGLAPFYPHPGSQLGVYPVVLAGVFLLAVTLWALASARRRPARFVGWFWFLGTMVPMIGLVQVGYQQMADRYAYLPLIGLYVAATELATSLAPAAVWPNRMRVLTAVGAIAAYTALGFAQVSYWHDGDRLFRHALAVAEDNAVARQGLASALFRKGEIAEALAHLQRAIEIDPGDRQPHYTAGRILHAEGRWDEAANQFLKALAIDENYAEAHHDLGLVLCAQGKYWEALGHFERAIEIDPQLVQGYMNLGYVCYRLQYYADSIAFNERALALDPSLIGCHRSIAASLAAEGRISEAIEKYHYVASISPEDKEVRAEMTQLLERQAALAEKRTE